MREQGWSFWLDEEMGSDKGTQECPREGIHMLRIATQDLYLGTQQIPKM